MIILGYWNDNDCNEEYNFVCKRPQGTVHTMTPAPTQLTAGGCPTGYDGVHKGAIDIIIIFSFNMCSMHKVQADIFYKRMTTTDKHCRLILLRKDLYFQNICTHFKLMSCFILSQVNIVYIKKKLPYSHIVCLSLDGTMS